MKIKIGYFDIDVKAKHETSSKMNEKETKAFLVFLGNALADASRWNKTQGYEYTSLTLQNMVSDICKSLDI